VAIPLKEEFFLVVEAQLCERRNDALAERSLSRGSTRATSAILAQSQEHFGKYISSQKEPLANACFIWLLML